MPVIQTLQILLVFLVGAFAALVTWNNIADPRSNLRFVEHLMRMDTIFPDSRLRSRAIQSPLLHRLTFGAIVVVEGLTAVACLAGALRLALSWGAPADVFHAAKDWAFAGLGLGFALWFGGFMVIGGQWFASWQSRDWNGRESAFMFYSAIGIAILVLLHRA